MSGRRGLGEEAATFAVALRFLTRLPVPGGLHSPAREAKAVRYYPAVGMLVGAAGAAVFWIAALLWPPLVALLLATAATLALTGAFHEDGLADTFDGIGGGADRARALAIMKDSRIGTYGAAALGLALALKLAGLSALDAALVPAALVAGHGLSRLSALLMVATGRYARPEGTAGFTAEGIGAASLLVALATGLLCLALAGIAAGWGAALAGIAGLAVGHGLARFAFERRLGGYTGDTLGCVQQMSEIGFYLGIAAWL